METAKPNIERCYFERRFESTMPVMDIHWTPDCVMEKRWHLPDGVVLTGPAPERFGVSILRLGDDSYRVRMLWNRVFLSWESLTRAQIMASSISILLTALGTDLWYLLNQPVQELPLAA